MIKSEGGQISEFCLCRMRINHGAGALKTLYLTLFWHVVSWNSGRLGTLKALYLKLVLGQLQVVAVRRSGSWIMTRFYWNWRKVCGEKDERSGLDGASNVVPEWVTGHQWGRIQEDGTAKEFSYWGNLPVECWKSLIECCFNDESIS